MAEAFADAFDPLPTQNSDDMTMALQALTSAIEANTAIPSGFKAMVDQNLPEGLAQRALYVPHEELFGMMSGKGLINGALQSRGDTRARSILEWFGSTLSGQDARAIMPNAFQGELVEGGNAETGQRSPGQPPVIMPGDPEWYRRGT